MILILTSIVGGAILPAAVQRFTVDPNELERETPYIERNIAATRSAFALDTIEEREFTAADAIGDADLAQNPEALSNVRLWDHRPPQRHPQHDPDHPPPLRLPRLSMSTVTPPAARSTKSSSPPAN